MGGRAKWLATVDRLVNSEVSDSLTLRFYQWDEASLSYVLNTRTEEPHKGRVTAMAFHPTQGERTLLLTSLFCGNAS